MGIRDEVLEMKKEVEEIQEHSFAMELLKEAHKKNKRQFIIILVLIGLLALAVSYIVFLLNDISKTTSALTNLIFYYIINLRTRFFSIFLHYLFYA